MNTLKIALSAILSITTYSASFADRLPDFSWDTVPRYMHVRKATSFTPQEVEYLATFPLITFEKTTGAKEFGGTEVGTWKAAKAVKAINPRTKVLYYRNILVHYSAYAADAQLASIPDAFLSDQKGNTKLVRGKVPAYDLSNPAVQDWWLTHAKQACGSEYIDGIFVDGNIKALEHGYLKRQVGDAKKTAVEQGYHHIMKQLRAIAGTESLVVSNIIRARFTDAGLEYMEPFDGSYIEGFEHAVGGMSRKEYMAKGIAAIQSAAQSGKIIAFTIGQGSYADTDMDMEASQDSTKEFASPNNRFTYALALFLICAEKHSYFMFSDGYGVDNGRSKYWMKDIPEYQYPLGAPTGEATREGYVYQREFQHASVTVDIEQETSEIVWKQ
ncbi:MULTISPECIES: putative glycoside hydrolase [unclassified Lentimonas]|uniref:putative glycoside hydrolase n=1 Tax=unclassified Lentimonas TaxID=2630993 RepID=UPI0013231B03|nr:MULTISPECIES: putative glycoside hydrolase [unclassified Lentimonas]CAA6677776.1 Unannotated [Lentimonas sp. CC4]CAA6685041.1 Unannotated [Lentimonas sp. CC6]CAA7077841.1 Unannotated [Lentimonas sp. CC4]CAA7169770.1 Unannotated [Lentimonas sp. CC21]CAA7179888.1 Unannotated [Lentimonas sp. CC8]